MSTDNVFKVIPVPVNGIRRGKWSELVDKLKSLPDGSALEIETKSQSDLTRTFRSYGLSVRTSRLSEGVFAVWEKRS